MKISTWNLRHGGGNRITLILEILKQKVQNDVFVLTEFRKNQNKNILENGLKELGYRFIATTEAGPKLNSVLIASKIPFEYQNDFPILNIHKQRVIKVKINNYTIYGCYFPGQDLKKVIFDFLLSEIEENGKENLVITGDINTGKHYLDEVGATFYHSDYMEKIENSGLIDAWRHIHGNKKEYSWFSNAGNGFRLDHFFVDEKLSTKILNCEYFHSTRENKISDHSMMILELDEE